MLSHRIRPVSEILAPHVEHLWVAAKDFESCETVSIAESAQCPLVRCPAQLPSCEQISLYSKIDIVFPVHGKWRLRLERSRKQMLNSRLAKSFGV